MSRRFRHRSTDDYNGDKPYRSSNSHARKLDFEKSLIIIKVGLIVTFFLVTAIYDTMYRDYKHAQTQLHSYHTRWKVGVEVVLNFLSGALCTAYIWKMRGGKLFDKKMAKNASVVGLILGLFALSLESSGLNRFLAREETRKGVGVYAQIDASTYGGIRDLDVAANAGDPFLMSFSVLAISLVTIVVAFNTLKMFRLTYDAYKSKDHPIDDVTWFKTELLGVIVLSVVPPILAARIKGEEPTTSTFVVAAGTAVAAVVLQFMLQYQGILDGKP